MTGAAIFLVFAIVGGFALAGHYFSSEQRIKRELKAAKQYAIAELPESTPGKIVGVATPVERQLVSPLTGRPCVCYQVVVQEQRGSGKHRSWRTVITEDDSVPFQVTDGTGRAIVDPTGAQLALDYDGNSASGSFDNATPTEEAFLQKHGRGSRGWLLNKTIRYREAIIGVGERVSILGAGVREPDPDTMPTAAYRDGSPTRLRLMSSQQFKLRISDDPETLGSAG